MWGANDPCCRKPMVWEDMIYKDETTLPAQSKKKVPDKVAFDKEMFNHYKKLIALRNSNIALRLGDFVTLLTDNKNRLYGYSRNYKGQYIVIILNNGERESSFKLSVLKAGNYKDILNGEILKTINNGEKTNVLSGIVSSKWGKIMVYE
jgi:glycosidase